jgi:hypothetical protein
MARNTRKTSKPNGRKRKGNKKSMKKQKGGGDLQIVQYEDYGRRPITKTVDSTSLEEIIKSINISMKNFNQRIIGCENELHIPSENHRYY